MAQHGEELYFDSNSDEEINKTYHDSFEEEDSITDEFHGEQISSNF